MSKKYVHCTEIFTLILVKISMQKKSIIVSNQIWRPEEEKLYFSF